MRHYLRVNMLILHHFPFTTFEMDENRASYESIKTFEFIICSTYLFLLHRYLIYYDLLMSNILIFYNYSRWVVRVGIMVCNLISNLFFFMLSCLDFQILSMYGSFDIIAYTSLDFALKSRQYAVHPSHLTISHPSLHVYRYLCGCRYVKAWILVILGTSSIWGCCFCWTKGQGRMLGTRLVLAKWFLQLVTFALLTDKICGYFFFSF